MGEVHILHVDDEQPFLDVTSELLEHNNEHFTVTTATSATAGLRLQAETEIDCIVSDYNMPEMNGIEFLRAIRERDAELPFILFTGKGSEEVASDAISAGVTDYLQKTTASEQYELLANRIETAVSQYRTTRELERERDLFRKAKDFTNVGAWEYVIDGETNYDSAQLKRIHGLDPEDSLPPEKAIQFYHPEDRPIIREAFEAAIEDGESYELELRLIDVDGNERWVRTRGEPQYEDGQVVRVRGSLQDITEQKERELRLERYEAIVENTDAGVYLLGEEGQIEFVNQSVIDASGIPYEEWTDEHVSVLADIGVIDNGAADAIDTEIAAISSGEKATASMELEPELETAPDVLYLQLQALKTGDDEHVLAFTHDITELKRRKRELERQNKRLEEFTGVVSHDLRNPLSVASHNLELAAEEHESKYIDTATRAIERSEALVDDLLTRARNGETVGETDAIALGELARECWQNVESETATLRVDLDLTIRADTGRLQQLLENLYRNAVEHGGETVTVGALADGFYVEDDGPGLPAHPKKLLEPGYTTAEDGTGFGLYIVEQIATAHGWEVKITDGASGGVRIELTGIEISQ